MLILPLVCIGQVAQAYKQDKALRRGISPGSIVLRVLRGANSQLCAIICQTDTVLCRIATLPK
jgi:hypothetical protein